MSIYATCGVFWVPGDDDAGDPVRVWIQLIPGHVGHPSYGPDDYYCTFLPPPPENQDDPRAVVFVTDSTRKDGQRYVHPLLTITGQEWAETPFIDILSELTRIVAARRRRKAKREQTERLVRRVPRYRQRTRTETARD